jgi:hypothetical protein
MEDKSNEHSVGISRIIKKKRALQSEESRQRKEDYRVTGYKKPRQHPWRKNHDNSDMIVICLSDGPRTIAEIERQFIEFPRSFGLFIELFDPESIEHKHLTRELLGNLERMTEAGLVERHEERYALTSLGHQKAAIKLAGLRKMGMLTRKLMQPQMVSKISLSVHLGLAALKAPCGPAFGQCGAGQRCC